MMKLAHIYKKLPVVAYDCGLIPVAWYLAYWLRYNLKPFPTELFSQDALLSLGFLGSLQIICYYHCRVYRGLWAFTSLNEVMRILKAVTYALLLAVPLLYLTALLQHIPRSVLPLYAMLWCTLLCGGRVMVRLYNDYLLRRSVGEAVKRVLVIGAGQAGEGLIRDLQRTPSYAVVGILDDHPRKRDVEIHGVPVLGALRDLPEKVATLHIDLVFIAIPSARAKLMRRIVDYCEASKVSFRTLPSLSALIDGRVTVHALREVVLEDLLGRDEVKLDWEKIHHQVQHQRIMVTGGGGSIGSELCRQLLALQPQALFLIEHSEYALYQREQEFAAFMSSVPVHYILANITDKAAMQHWFQHCRPTWVFHAAAYKHAPSLEARVREAVWNNVIGTQVVVEASMMAQVEKFIFISTDKAVNPTSLMGATKRLAEMYCQAMTAQTAMQLMTVRFGNVLGSTGSVVPLFYEQLRAGKPLTVTHPDIERFFMTIPEACQLILQAMVQGTGGEIFVLDMGEPIKIRYLAEQMIRLSGCESEIIYTGLRPGEKLYEELFYDHESLLATDHEKLFKASSERCDWAHLKETFQLILHACAAYDEKELTFLLKNCMTKEVKEESLS